MSSAKEKQPYLQTTWMLPTVLAVGTARGGAGGGGAGGGGAGRAGGGRAGAAAAAASSATGGRGGVRTSSRDGGAESSDMFIDYKKS